MKIFSLRMLFCLGLLLFALLPVVCFAQNATTTIQFEVDPPTLRSIGFRWYIEGDDDEDATGALKYRKVGETAWKQGYPMLRVHEDIVDEGANEHRVGNLLAGSVLFLEPDTSYEVEIAIDDPDGVQGTATRIETVTTRAVPVCPEPDNTRHLYPPGWQGEKLSPSYNNLGVALDDLVAGELLLVHPGIHPGGAVLGNSGTEAKPICIRGAGGGESIIQIDPGVNKDNRANLSFYYHGDSETAMNFVFIEDLTFSGGGVAIEAPGADNLVVRNCKIVNANSGINNNSKWESDNWYIVDNEIIGTNEAGWYPRSLGYGKPATTGVNIFGRGHVVAYNTIRDFWDGLAIANGAAYIDKGQPRPPSQQCFSIDFYNNDIFNARDDLMETDECSHNIRVFNNRLYNGHVGISVQPMMGGPLYIVRNEVYNATIKTLKLQSAPSGMSVFNNTLVSSERGLSAVNFEIQNTTFRNNLVLGIDGAKVMEAGSKRKIVVDYGDIPDPDTRLIDDRTTLDYNGWRQPLNKPWFIEWNGQSYKSLSDYRVGTNFGAHSILIDFDDFVAANQPVKGVTYSPGAQDLRLNAASDAIDGGVQSPNITGPVIGVPDLGALEFGLPLPHYGVRVQEPAEYALYEFGQVSADHVWRTVTLDNGYVDPVVILGPPSYQGSQPVLVRLRNVDSGGFQVRLQEYEYLDGNHVVETIPYLVVKSGRHAMADGSIWEAGTVEIDGSADWYAETFTEGFPQAPHVFLTVQTYDGAQAVTVRARNVTAQGFEAALFEQQSLMDGHAWEKIGYLAIYSPTGSGELEQEIGSYPYLLQRIALDHRWRPVLSSSLKLEEEQSLDGETAHVDETVAVLALDNQLFAQDITSMGGDTAALRRKPPGYDALMEWGAVEGVTHEWVTVPMAKTYTDPVIVASVAKQNGSDLGVVRLRNVTPTSFQVRFQEWHYLDGFHTGERIFYLVAEAGEQNLGNLPVEAGKLDTEMLVANGWVDEVEFMQLFSETPTLFTSVMTYEGGDPVTTRIHNLSASNFALAMQEQESKFDGHVPETLGWIALGRGMSGLEDGRRMQALAVRADHNPLTVQFGQTLDRRFPVVLQNLVSTWGGDPATAAQGNLAAGAVEVYVKEEQSADSEMGHVVEDISVFAAE